MNDLEQVFLKLIHNYSIIYAVKSLSHFQSLLSAISVWCEAGVSGVSWVKSQAVGWHHVCVAVESSVLRLPLSRAFQTVWIVTVLWDMFEVVLHTYDCMQAVKKHQNIKTRSYTRDIWLLCDTIYSNVPWNCWDNRTYSLENVRTV